MLMAHSLRVAGIGREICPNALEFLPNVAMLWKTLRYLIPRYESCLQCDVNGRTRCAW